MRTVHGRLFAISMLLALASGCAATRQVRYVYQDGEFGVIGMPENSDRWPTHYRRQAERMMKDHFPDGHEIVRAEEVVEGTRTLTVQGTSTAGVLPVLPATVLQLGRSSCRSQADKMTLKECRIVYRRAGRAVGPVVYAPTATLKPTRYVDPNDPEHRPAHVADAAGGEKTKSDDKPEPALNLAGSSSGHAAASSATTAALEPAGGPPRQGHTRTANATSSKATSN